MTITPEITEAPTYPHGVVRGRYLRAVADTPDDPGREMDWRPAEGKVTFTPVVPMRRAGVPVPALFTQQAVVCAIDTQGYLTDQAGERHVHLIAGQYKVRFDIRQFRVPGPRIIEVTAEHTVDNPLDLVLAMEEPPPPPGSVVVVDESTALRASRSAWEASAAADRAEDAAEQAETSTTTVEAAADRAGSAETAATQAATRAESAAEGSEDSAVRASQSADTAASKAGDAETASTTATDAASRAAKSATQADASATSAAESATRAGSAADALNADAGEFGDAVRAGTFTGAPGPAPSIKIGEVTSGPTPSATITGTSPDLTLGLVLPESGPSGSAGGVPTLYGPGRPDSPETTGGVITGSEPVGTDYRSEDGAGVGAYVWRKRPGDVWEVVDGDTGWRDMNYLFPSWDPGAFGVFMRRINAIIYLSLTIGSDPGSKQTDWGVLPVGLRGPGWLKHFPMGTVSDGAYVTGGYVMLGSVLRLVIGDQATRAGTYFTYTSADVWLDAPAGVPGDA